MTYTCTRRIQFCAGHRVANHETKCRNLHGHNYVALVTAAATKLDPLGRVIDFGVLQQYVGGWIDREWDHGFIVWSEDVEALAALRLIQKQKIYRMPTNPTAENMAAYLKAKCNDQLLHATGVEVVGVRLWETENCYADA